MSSRLSLGGRSVLRDGASRCNSRPRTRSASASKRQSLGSYSEMSSLRSETPKQDRRLLLDEWRRSRGIGESTPSALAEERGHNNKRSRAQEAPPLPRNTFTTSTPDGMSALERFRLRKHQKLQQNEESSNASRAIDFDDDDTTSDFSRAASSLLSTASPNFNGRLGGARRRSVSARKERSGSEITASSSVNQTLSQLTQESDTEVEEESNVDTVEGAGLRSRVREMQQRVEQLEKEKMVLSMAKAPLEARFRQKEDTWSKKEKSLIQEIDSLKQSSREANERYRDLEVKHDDLEEECKKLRHAVRMASSSRQASAADDSAWSRQLQNDRDVADLKEKLRAAEEEIDSIRLAKVSVEKELHATKIELDCLLRTHNELQEEFQELTASSSENKEAEIKLQVLTTEHIATSAQLNAVYSDLAATKARADATLEAKDEEHKKEVAELQFEMSVLKTRAGNANDGPKSADVEDEAVLIARIEERDRRIADLEAQVFRGDQIRRQMHNRIQELRGNIRVFVRTRPFLPGDGGSAESSIEVAPDGESLSIEDQRSKNPHDFKFDKVFPPSAGQDVVFNEVADFVQSALDGYHVCLFSYGQTGSGKTHTMQGSGNGAMRGIIPRAVEKILSEAKAMQNHRWDFRISASFLEIYNEDLKDLLVSMRGGSRTSSRRSAKLSIKRNREGKSYVDGLTEVPIAAGDFDEGMQQLESLMRVAARARSVASTQMNAQSSRSHSVFMLHLHGYNEDNGTVVHGALNLCDLAGSERLDRSGAGEDSRRLRETQSINKSLSCLGDVFNALATGASHVPYRNSKLTYLLQDCLSGDGKALMFVNLSPTIASSGESLCSLRFAHRVNQVELGKPTKHVQYASGKTRA